jgi:hypothetical protein
MPGELRAKLTFSGEKPSAVRKGKKWRAAPPRS